MRYFDANAILGEPLYSMATGEFERYCAAGDLLDEMDACGVEAALVTHWDSLRVHPSVGNQRLMEAVAGHDRLHPCWVVLPHHTGESPEPEALRRMMAAESVRAVRLVPHLFGFSLAEWSVGPLLSMLEAERLPTLIEAGAEELHGLCERHPLLPVIAVAGEPRQLYPLLAKHANLYLSLAGPSHPDLIEDACARFGAGRLLFAGQHVPPLFPTGAARDEPGAWRLGPSVATVSYARVGAEEKAGIAGGTLRRLLGLDGGAATTREPVGAVARAACRGEPLPAGLIDMHFHLGPWMYTYHPGTGVEAALAMMEAVGATRLYVSSAAAVAGGDHYAGNREVAAWCRQHPDRLTGVGVINPHFGDTEKEIDRCLVEYGFRGLKVHPRTHQCDLLDRKYEPVWQGALRHGVHVQAHTGEGQTGASPRAFDTIAGRYPTVRFLLIHAGDNLEGLRVCLDVARRRANVYLGLSDVAFMYRGMLEYAVGRVGADRVVFESDCGTINMNHTLGIVAFARLRDEQKAAILKGNAERLVADAIVRSLPK